MPPARPPVPAVAPLLLAAAAAAVAIDLSPFHQFHHADTLIPVLVSLQKWRLFYWDQDRIGMLVPLLAAPVRHPFGNLLVQSGASIFGALAAVVLVARVVNPTGGWPAAAAGGCGVLLVGVTGYDRFQLLGPSLPYGAALALVGAALLLVSRPGGGGWRPIATAAGLFAVASWLNIGLAVVVGPWLVARWGLGLGAEPGPGGGRWSPATALLARAGAGLVVGTAVGVGLMALADVHDTRYGSSPVERWADGWEQLGRAFGDRFPGVVWALAGAAGLAAVWVAVPRTRAAGARAARELVAAAAALVAAVGALGASAWVADNDYDVRYLLPAVILIAAPVANAAVGPAVGLLPPLGRRAVTTLAAVLIPGMAVGVYGWPSTGAARGALDRATGPWTEPVLAAGCTHLTGDYWEVWPAVFHANLVLADRGEARTVWGVTERSAATRAAWAAVPPAEVRVGWLVRAGEAEPPPRTAKWWRPEFPTARLVARRPEVWVYALPESGLPAVP